MRRHVACTYVAMWRTKCMFVRLCARMCMYVHVCENVCVCMISEIKHPFQDFR